MGNTATGTAYGAQQNNLEGVTLHFIGMCDETFEREHM